MHGYGRMVFPDGSKKEGYFKNNIYQGDEVPADTESSEENEESEESGESEESEEVSQIG